MASKGSIMQGLRERNVLGMLGSILSRLVVDTTNRLQVTLTGSNTLTTVTTVTSLTNWGVQTAQQRSQMDSHLAYQAGLRRNLM